MSQSPKANPVKPRCGLCGKTRKLTRTPCCGNWICDDADKYVAFSYARNSCYRNHTMFTLCGFHHSAQHDGRWQDCPQCRESGPLELYVYHGTNEYNFEKLPNPPAFEPTYCGGCGVIIRLSQDSHCLRGEGFFCDACTARTTGMTSGQVQSRLLSPAPEAAAGSPELSAVHSLADPARRETL